MDSPPSGSLYVNGQYAVKHHLLAATGDYSFQVKEKKRRVDVVRRSAAQKSGGCLTVVWQVEQPVSVAPLIVGDWTVRVRYTLDGKEFSPGRSR